jgi:large subunit ribosomal protein L9
MVAAELEKRGYQIERKRVEIPDHTIRTVGSFKVKVKLYDREEAMVKLAVEGVAQGAQGA